MQAGTLIGEGYLLFVTKHSNEKNMYFDDFPANKPSFIWDFPASHV